MSTNDVIVRLRALGLAAFEGAMQGAAKSVSGVGDAADHTAKQTDKLTGSAEKSGKTFRQTAGKVAKWAATAAVVGKAVGYMHSSIEATEGLAKSTMKLSRTTGMSTETSSAWAEIAKTRNIDTAQLNRGFVALSRQMVAGAAGTKSSVAVFKQLGVSMDTLRAGDTNAVIHQTADAFQRMQNPAQKAALAQKLFGRSGQDLLPLLNAGSKGIGDQIDMAKKYGAVIGTDGVAHTKEMAAQQRELKMASDGLKISLGEALVPAMLAVTGVLTQLAAVMQPVLRNSWALKAIIGLLTVAFVTYQVAQVAATIAALSFNAALLLIPLAIAALVIGIVIAYKKIGWFHSAVNAAWGVLKALWSWVGGAWQAIGGFLAHPIQTALGLIRKAFDGIKHAASGVVGWFHGLGSKLIHAIADGISSAPGIVVNAIKSMLPGGKLGAKLLHALPGFALGGVMPHSGLSVVGERGPELMQLPGGTRITPLPAPALHAPALAGASAALGRPVVAQVYLDRRMIATAVADDTGDRKARR